MTGITPKSPDRNTALAESQPISPEELPGVYSTLDTFMHTLHGALPPRIALLLFTGHSDPRCMAALNLRKSAFDSATRNGKKPEELNKDL
jgi:RNA exonuclease 1